MIKPNDGLNDLEKNIVIPDREGRHVAIVKIPIEDVNTMNDWITRALDATGDAFAHVTGMAANDVWVFVAIEWHVHPPKK